MEYAFEDLKILVTTDIVLSPKEVSKPTSITAESSSCSHKRMCAQLIWRTLSILFQLLLSMKVCSNRIKYLVMVFVCQILVITYSWCTIQLHRNQTEKSTFRFWRLCMCQVKKVGGEGKCSVLIRSCRPCSGVLELWCLAYDLFATNEMNTFQCLHDFKRPTG